MKFLKKLFSCKESRKKKAHSLSIDDLAEKIVLALGGKENIISIDACISRIRARVKDESLVVSDDAWKGLDCEDVIRAKKGIQLVYGKEASLYKNAIKKNFDI